MTCPIVEHPVRNFECWFRVSLLKFLFFLGSDFFCYFELGLESASSLIDVSGKFFMSVFVKTWRKSSIAGLSISFFLGILIWLLRKMFSWHTNLCVGLENIVVLKVNVETWVILEILFAWMTEASMGSHESVAGPIIEDSWNWESVIWLLPCFF